MTATVAEKYPAKVVNLCRSLKKGAVPLSKLPEELRSDEVLGFAFTDGLVEVGRQAYTLIPLGDAKIAKDEKGKPTLDEMCRQKMVQEYRVAIDNEWSWMTVGQKNRAPLGDVLGEESVEDVPELHVRITSAGLAATI